MFPRADLTSNFFRKSEHAVQSLRAEHAQQVAQQFDEDAGGGQGDDDDHRAKKFRDVRDCLQDSNWKLPEFKSFNPERLKLAKFVLENLYLSRLKEKHIVG